ncbi:hypothetical protein CBER1_09122 [Cercospora berteroae]|uniref:Uncharacterized protein n=1 Tax=Cercospora berteroae TaxID=357750 RepID=A0A2S6CAN5_9PEZI|nr:hypothetical protein CBER1_09122 [Cercospora berteroae]
MTRLEAKCTSPDFIVALSSFEKLHDLRFHGGPDFQSSLQEFEKRFDEFNRIPGGMYFDQDYKCLLFLTALDGVDYFRQWITLISQVATVAGHGTGPPLTFRSLALKAENWNIVECSEGNAPYQRERQRLDAAYRRGADRSSGQLDRLPRTPSNPPTGILLGPIDAACMWPGHNGTHTNGECIKQNDHLYREVTKGIGMSIEDLKFDSALPVFLT